MHTHITNIRWKIYYNSIFRIKSLFRRYITSKLNLKRPPSFPYITGDGFRSIAEHVFDDISDITVSEVQCGDIIFVRSDFLVEFFKKIHPCIQNRYILISGNSDKNFTDEYIQYIDSKIIHVFAQNVLIKHPKITPIPIGLILRRYDSKNKTVQHIEKYKRNTKKSNKIYYSFSVETNPVRNVALTHLSKNLISIGNTDIISKESYFEQMSSYTFNASPEGNGIDCHRTWETMYLRSVPIVTRNASTQYWFDMGLPMFLIDSWEHIDSIKPETLSTIYTDLENRFQSPLLYMEYWIKKIIEQKTQDHI